MSGKQDDDSNIVQMSEEADEKTCLVPAALEGEEESVPVQEEENTEEQNVSLSEPDSSEAPLNPEQDEIEDTVANLMEPEPRGDSVNSVGSEPQSDDVNPMGSESGGDDYDDGTSLDKATLEQGEDEAPESESKQNDDDSHVSFEPDGSFVLEDPELDQSKADKELIDKKDSSSKGDEITDDIHNSSAWDVVSMLSFPPDWNEVRSAIEDDTLPNDSKTHFILNLRYQTKLHQTLLHLAFTHEDKAPAQVIELIVELCGAKALEAVDDEGNTPLHYACETKAPIHILELFIRTTSKDALLKVNRKGETPIDIMYISNEDASDYISFLQMQCNDEMGSLVPRLPLKTIKSTLNWTQNQSANTQKELLKSNFLQTLINTVSCGPAYVGVIMADLYLQILVVWSLSSQNQRFLRGFEPMQTSAFILLSVLCFWDGIRLIFQIVSTPFRAFVTNLYSWLRLAQFILISSLLTNGLLLQSTQYLDYILVTGIAWIILLFVLSDLNYEVAVFLSATLKSIAALLPFAVVLSITIISFAHMYYMSSVTAGQCTGIETDWTCDLSKTTEATFQMILDTVNYNFADNSSNTMMENVPLSIAFAIIVWLLLLNILLAQIINVFSKVRDDGISEFWARRFIYITEHPLIAFSSSFISPVAASENEKYGANLASETADLNTASDVDPESGYSTKVPYNPMKLPARFDFNLLKQDTAEKYALDEEELKFCNWWTGLTSDLSAMDRASFLFGRVCGSEIVFPGKTTERALFSLSRNGDVGISSVIARIAVYFLIYPLSLLVQLILFGLGCATFGLLWPSYIREYLFSGPTNIAVEKETESEVMSEIKAFIEDLNEMNKKKIQ